MKTISSRHNPLVARFRALGRARRTNRTEVLLESAALVRDAYRAGVALDVVLASGAGARQAGSEIATLVDTLTRAGVNVVLVTDPVLRAASPARAPSGLVAIGHHRPATLSRLFRHPTCAVAAVGVQDPGNVGAIIRAADAAGASGVAVSEGSADPFGWRALRGAMGSTFRLPVVDVGPARELIDAARTRDIHIIAAVPRRGVPLETADLTGPMLVLMGGEGDGLEPELATAADTRLTIPMRTGVESLNTAVAAALILYEARRQRLRSGREKPR